MKMVEKVARAIFDLASVDDVTLPWERVTEGNRELHREWARAAIRAMREPTEAMIAAGTKADWVGEIESRAGDAILATERPNYLDPENKDYDRTGIWPAMIDAALPLPSSGEKNGL